MSNSLLIAGLETVGYDTNPEYHLGSGLDFGEILPDTDTISSVLLDGDVISGTRTGNRTWNLTVVVQGQDRADLAVKTNTFIQAINATTFPVIWTPDSCASSVFAAYRATFTVAKDFAVNGNFVAQVTITFETAPFAKSLSPTTIGVTATAAPPQIQIDGMNTGTFTGGTLDTTLKFEGAGSMKFTLAQYTVGPVHSVSYGYKSSTPGRNLLGGPLDISAEPNVSTRLNWPAPGSGLTWTVTVVLTLASSGGSSTVTTSVPVRSGATSWALVTFDLTALTTISGTGVDLTAVTAWNVFVSSDAQLFASPPPLSTAHVDDLRAYPPGSIGNSTTNGSVLTIPGVVGSARTPAAFELDLSGATFTDMLVHSPPIDQDPDVAILVGLSGGTVTVPSANMNYDGTYGCVAYGQFVGSGTRTVTVTLTQKLGATTIATLTATATVTTTGSVNQPVSLGNITLPLVELPAENSTGSLVVAVASTGGSDSFTSVAFCDTEGQTILFTGLTGTTQAIYIDAPDPTVGVGPMYASTSLSRTTAYNAMAQLAAMPGGPVYIEPGNNRLLTASSAGTPNVSATLFPAWLDEALS